MTTHTELLALAKKWRDEAETGRAVADKSASLAARNTISMICDSMCQLAGELESALARAEQGEAPVCHGMRRKGTSAIIGIVPNKIAGKPATAEAYLCDFEEVPLYLAPPPSPASGVGACDMGILCIGCQPRNADGTCPDAAPQPEAAQPGELDMERLAVALHREHYGEHAGWNGWEGADGAQKNYFRDQAKRAAAEAALAATVPEGMFVVDKVLARYQDARVFGNPHTRQVARAIAAEVAAAIAAAQGDKT